MTGQQPYDVAERRDGFELRRYPAHLVAEIEVAGSFDEAPNRAFRPLAGYINGANRSRRRIAMTAPVTQQAAGPEKIAMTAPVLQQAAPARPLPGAVRDAISPHRRDTATPSGCPGANAGDPAAAGGSGAILRPVDTQRV